MATFRVGVGSFNIQDGAVGFGTDTDGLGNLKVKGVTKTIDIKVSGASTLTRYSGFAADNINQLENITLTSEVGTIGDIVVGVGTSVIISSASTVTVGTVESVSIGTHFSPPVGGFEERGEDFLEGMMRFNTDLNTMEFYNGNEWRQFTYILDIQNSPSGRGRGVFGGGLGPGPSLSNTLTIDFVNIHSQGNALEFGNLTGTYRGWICAVSNGTRGVWNSGSDYGGGNTSAIIDYVTIASEGDAIDFGDPSFNSFAKAAFSSTTRGVWGGGWNGSNANVNTIEYIEIATLGNALDFGDLAQATRGMGSSGNQIRGIFAGGQAANDNSNFSSDIDFVTIASKGNATSFGNLTSRKRMDGGGQVSNSIKGLFWNTSGSTTAGHGVDSITIASEGNAVFFADGLTNESVPTCTSNKTRGVFAGGYNPAPTSTNAIDFVQFSTSGQVFDFGDLTEARMSAGGCSDSHGGLGGY